MSKSTLKGVQVWIDTFNLAATTANILLGDMILDGNDDILITGAVYNGSNNYDALTLKYTSAGSLSWYELYDGTASFYDGGLRIAVDANDNVFVTGGTSSTISNMDLLVLAYQSNGTLSWSVTHDGYGAFDAGSYVAAISTSTVHIVALSESTVSEKWHVLDRKYNSTNGSLIAGASSDEVTLAEVGDVTLDANDNIYITGWKPTTTQGRDIVVVKLDDGATIQWEKTFNGTADADDQANAIAVATNGDVIVGGFITTSSSDRDGLLLKYNSSGTLQWQQTISGAASGEDEITDVLLATGSSEIYLCGQIHEVADEDYLLQRRSSSTGSLLHELTFAGWVGGNDRAETLLEDEDGGIIMSGKTAAGANGQFPTAVRFAKKDYFLPPNSETSNAALPYIHQYDQLTKTNGTVAEDIKYYAGNHYLENAQLSIVQARIDTVPTTPDTLCRVDVTFSDDKSQRVFALDKRSSYHNYYLGHINEGRTKVPLTDQVLHTDAWTGIDLLHGSNGAGHTYDIIIEPGVDPDAIVFTFTGHTSLAVNGSGELEITTALGTIVWPEPTLSSYDAAGTSYSNTDTPAYSLVGSNKVEITGVNSVSNRYLVIGVRGGIPTAPTGGSTNLEWCSFIGGNREDVTQDIGTRSTPNGDDLLVTGYTRSNNFPNDNGAQPFPGDMVGSKDAFLTRFDDDINLVWSTYLGGTANEEAFTVLVEEEIITIGGTAPTSGLAANGTNFPLLDNGESFFDNENRCSNNMVTCADGFIARFLFDGQADHITFLGEDGSSVERIRDIVKYVDGGYLVVGLGADATLVIESGSYSTSIGRSFINKFSAGFGSMIWGTQFPAGDIREVEADQNNNIFIAGVSQRSDATPIVAENVDTYPGTLPTSDNPAVFIAKFSPSPHDLSWSTYFGGDENFEQLYDLKLTPDNEPVIVGWTRSDDFPVTDNVSSPFFTMSTANDNGFYTEFSNTGALLYSGLMGAQINDLDIEDDGETSLAVTPAGGVGPLLVTGPMGTLQITTPSAGYILVMDEDRNPSWATYLGGTQDFLEEIDVTENRRMYFGGRVADAASNTNLADFPTVMYAPNAESFFANRIIKDNPFLFSIFLGFFDLDVITDVEEVGVVAETVSVFPNPTSAIVYISASIPITSTVSVFDATGRYLSKVALSPVSGQMNTYEINLSAYPAGAYFLSWESNNQLITKKIILTR